MPKVVKEYREMARNKIIDAAAEVFYYEGLEKANMDDIAKKVGVTKGTLYLYFKSKEDLLIETCRITQATLESVMVSKNDGNIEERINSFIEKELSLPDHIKFFWLKMLGEINRNDEIALILRDEHKKYVKIIRNILTEIAKYDETLKSKDLAILSEIFVSFHNGIMVSIMQGIELDLAKLIIINGLKTLI